MRQEPPNHSVGTGVVLLLLFIFWVIAIWYTVTR